MKKGNGIDHGGTVKQGETQKPDYLAIAKHVAKCMNRICTDDLHREGMLLIYMNKTIPLLRQMYSFKERLPDSMQKELKDILGEK